MSHDGSPSPMYWVIWSVFQNLCTFAGFLGISGVPVLLQMVLDGFGVVWTYLGATRYNWKSLDVLGHVWTVPGHLVLGKCWPATPVGARSEKLTAGQGLM